MIAGILSLLTIHFIADFVLQDRHTAENKSKSIAVLIKHLLPYLFFLAIFAWIFNKSMWFPILNCVAHGVQDWVMWGYFYGLTLKLRKIEFNSEYKYWKDYYFYLTVGLDQFLHLALLLITFILL